MMDLFLSDGALIVQHALDVVDVEDGEGNDGEDFGEGHPEALFLGLLLAYINAKKRMI